METPKTLNITVSIDGINLPITVTSSEEEVTYRNAASLIQARIQKLRSLYPSVSNDKVFYAMAMLMTSVESVKTSELASTEPYKEMMVDLEKEIDALK